MDWRGTRLEAGTPAEEILLQFRSDKVEPVAGGEAPPGKLVWAEVRQSLGDSGGGISRISACMLRSCRGRKEGGPPASPAGIW